MATTQYKDNAEHIYEFQQEAGDAGGSEKRPVAGMPAQVRTQLAEMAASLAALMGTVLSGSLKVVIQAGTAVIGKLAPNPGVNIGTVDVNSGTFAVTGSLPVGTNHIGSVAVDAALPAGANTIGKVDVNTLPAIGQLPVNVGAKTSAASLSVVLATDQGTHGVSLTAPLPADTNNIGDVDVASMPTLPQLPATIGQKAKTTSLGVAIASDQIVPVSSAQLPAALGERPRAQALPVVICTDDGNGGVDVPVAISGYATPQPATAAAVSGQIFLTAGSSTTIAGANAARIGLLIVNNADTGIYVKLGTAVSATSWSILIEPHATWELPPRYYTGIVTAMMVSSGFSDVRVTETT